MKLIAIIVLTFIAGCTTAPIGGAVGKTQGQIDLESQFYNPFIYIQLYFYKWNLLKSD